MSLVSRDGAAGALEALGAGGGLGRGAAHALMSLGAAPVAASGGHPIVTLAFVRTGITLEFIRWWNSNRSIAEPKLIVGVPEQGGIVYQQQVVRFTQEPYTFRYSHPTEIITGIACIPMNKETQSPEAEIVEGGVSFNTVTIRLTPVDEGQWACDIAICGKSSNANPAIEAGFTHDATPPVDSTHDAAPPAYSTRDAAPPAYSTHDAAPPAYSSHDAAPPANSTHDAAPPAYSTHDAAPPAYSTHDAAPPAYSTHDAAPPAYSTHDAASPAPAVPADASTATSSRIPPLLVVSGVVVFLMLGVIMLMMIVIIIKL